MADPIKVFIPKQKEFVCKDDKYRITYFDFQREGEKKVEKGQHFTFKPAESDVVRSALKEAMDGETVLEIEIGEEKFNRLDIKFPTLVKSFPGGGGGGKPPQPPMYRGRKFSKKEFLGFYAELKKAVNKFNLEMYPEGLTVGERAELVRSEVSQLIIMIDHNVWNPE